MNKFFGNECVTSNWNFLDPDTPVLGTAAPAGSENANVTLPDGTVIDYVLGSLSSIASPNAGTYVVTGVNGPCPNGEKVQWTAPIEYLLSGVWVHCQNGWSEGVSACYKAISVWKPDLDKSLCDCNSLVSPSIDDPVNIANGFVYRNDLDVTISPGLEYRRYYNSSNYQESPYYGDASSRIGQLWRDSYSATVRVSHTTSITNAFVTRPSGQMLVFSPPTSGNAWVSDSDIFSVLTEIQDTSGNLVGWQYHDADTNNIENYDATGKLTLITLPGGRAIHVNYNSSNRLANVADDFGRSLTFTYGAQGQIASIADQAGNTWTYTYDSNYSTLISVKNPDGTGIAYHYEAGSNALLDEVGTLDANGNESDYLWFTYNDQPGNYGPYIATSTYEAGNAKNATISPSQTTGGQVTVSENVNSSTTRTRTYNFSLQANVLKLASTQGGCAATSCGLAGATYNANGMPATMTDFNGNVTSLTYDDAGLVTQRIEAKGTKDQRTTITNWDDSLRLPLQEVTEDASGNVTSKQQWVYNSFSEPLAVCQIDPGVAAAASYTCSPTGTVPTGVRRTTYTYCNTVDSTQCPVVGLVLSTTGSRTDLTQTTFFSYYMNTTVANCGTPGGACHQPGDLYQARDALGHITTIASYDGDGRVTRVVDANGVNTDFTYTPRGYLASRSVGGAVTSITYTPFGSVQTITDPDGVTTTYGYDGAHRLTRVSDNLGNYIQYTLDNDGNVTNEQTFDTSGTLRKGISRTFNALDQLTSIVDGLNATVFSAGYSDSYDGNGNLVHSSDGKGVQRQRSYDGLNRLMQTIDNYNGSDAATQNTTTKYTYDSLDRLSQLTDPSNLATTYGYDGLGNATAQQSPDTGSTSRSFDAAGNVLTRTDAKGITATTTYDALDRPLTVSYPDSTQNITYAYDEANSVTGCSSSYPNGRLTRIIEHTVTTVYCYDAHGNVIQKQQITAAGTDTVGYRYTAADRLSAIVYASGTQVSYGRDSDGRIQSITVTPPNGTASTVVSNVTYQPFGPVSGYTLGNGQRITRSYDANYRLTDLTSPVFNLHMARDVMGNVTAIGNAPGANPATETYSYDPLYRLTAITEADGSALESVTYNQTGDRLSKTGSGLATGTYSYNPNTHQLIATGNAARSVDANGNTTAVTQAGGTYGFGYSARNRMTVAQLGGNTVGSYAFNALNQRVQKVANGAAQRFDYDEASQMLAEYGSINRDYIWMDGIPVANVDVANGSSSVSYVVADQLGTPRAVADGNGNALWQWAYQGDAWGEQQPTSSGYTYNFRFPGQYADAESGLMQNGYRDYCPGCGRYIQSDPIGLAGGASTYAYVGGDPLGSSDLFGLQAQPVPAPTPMPTPGTGTMPNFGPPANDPFPPVAVPIAGICRALGAVGALIYPTPTADSCTDEPHPPAGLNCPRDDDKCKAIQKAIYEAMNELQGRIDDLLTDSWGLYDSAYDVRNPAYPEEVGTWTGHVYQAQGWQNRLRNLIKQAQKYGCRIPPGAWGLATRPLPSMPRGH